MRVVGLDLSKRSAGWAMFHPSDRSAASGIFTLGSEYTSPGRTYANLHKELMALHRLGRIEAIFYEEPLDPRFLSGATNKDTVAVLFGLAAHAESFGEAVGCRIIRAVNQVTWRRHFHGPVGRPRDARGKPVPVDWKGLAMERARTLGFRPQRHDQAEAIGILDFACDSLGIAVPWHGSAPRAGAML